MFKKVLFFSFVFFGSKSFCMNSNTIVWHVEGSVWSHFFAMRGIRWVDGRDGDCCVIMREFKSFSGGVPVQVGNEKEFRVKRLLASSKDPRLAVHLAHEISTQDIARTFGYSPESLLLLEPRISTDED